MKPKAIRPYFVLLIFSIMLSMPGCMKMRTNDRQTIKAFQKKGVSVHINRYEKEAISIRYIEVNQVDEKAPVIIFVHGAPGSSDVFYDYLSDSSLYNNAVLIAVDRPGYGFSDFGSSYPSISSQADYLLPLLEQHKHRDIILVGHSYGGPIIANMAMKEQVEGLLFLAPAIDPEHEKQFLVTALGKYPPTRWITPKSLKVATDEKVVHKKELEKIEKEWGAIDCKVIYMHGKDDFIVPFENYAFAQKKMKNCELEMIALEGSGHFFLWTEKDNFIEQLQQLLDEII